MNGQNLNDEILTFFKTLVDADRLRIAGLLGTETMSPVQLAERLHLAPMAVVNHLERLEAAGLVKQTDRAYTLDRKALEDLARRNLRGLRPPPKVDEFDGEAFDQKVIRDFSLPDGKLKSLPMQPKKFGAVLRYVVQVFEPGVEYPERQVNDQLKRFNEDTASLRRGLVDSGLMERSAGIYRKK
jgi:DNA-binding transcriptional ArsR family regulator